MYTYKQQKMANALEDYKRNLANALISFQNNFDHEKAKSSVENVEWEFIQEIERIFLIYKD